MALLLNKASELVGKENLTKAEKKTVKVLWKEYINLVSDDEDDEDMVVEVNSTGQLLIEASLI